MTEQIATWAGYIFTGAMLIMWTAWTVEAIALGNAGWAAFTSPFTVIGWILTAYWAAEKIGWITP